MSPALYRVFIVNVVSEVGAMDREGMTLYEVPSGQMGYKNMGPNALTK